LISCKMRIMHKWTRNLKIATYSLFLLLLAPPIGQDIHKFFKNRDYLMLREKYNNLLGISQERASILGIRSLAFLPYIPKRPQVKGQKKALIVVEIKIRNKRLAHNIRAKFVMDDAAGRRVDSQVSQMTVEQQSLIFSLLYPDTKLVTWHPDMPNAIENIARNKEKPFKLWLIVSWEGPDKKGHRLESYSELRYNQDANLYYFEERENKVIDS